MTSTLATSAAGSNCPTGGTDPLCTATVTVLVPGLTIAQTANVERGRAGTGGQSRSPSPTPARPRTRARWSPSHSRIGRRRRLRRGRGRDAGIARLRRPGADVDREPVAGETATITYSVTVNSPDTGDKLLITTARLPPRPGRPARPAPTSAPCQVTVPVLTPGLTITKTASTATAVPGQTVTYTVTITDTGQTPYAGASCRRRADRGAGRRGLQRRRRRHRRVGVVRRPNLTWTGEPVAGRIGDGHLLGHREQPRHRRPGPRQYRHLVGGGEQLRRRGAPTRGAPAR